MLGVFYSDSRSRLLDFKTFGLMMILDGFDAVMYMVKAC